MMVKMCGLRRARDAELSLELGASHLGVVLAADSPRVATLSQAREVLRVAAGRAPVVLVFRRQSNDAIERACDEVGSRRVQVHGASDERCAALRAAGMLPLPVLRVTADCGKLPTLSPAPDEQAPALLDGGSGGEGVAFDWRLLGGAAPNGVFIAGGIRPDNVVALLRHRPWGIDVSSGVERRPGVKDKDEMRSLFDAMRIYGEAEV